MAETVAERIENIWLAHVKDVPGLKTWKAQEPLRVDRKDMPLVALMFMLPQAIPSETGDGLHVGEDVDYRWEMSLYVGAADIVVAQKQMRDVSVSILQNFREHRSDYDLHPEADIFARGITRRTPPTPDDEMTFLRASWELQFTGAEGFVEE